MQLVFEFGSNDFRSIIEALRSALGEQSYNTKTLPANDDTYVLTDDRLESAGAKLVRGDLSAFSIHPLEGEIRYGLVLKPNFEGEALSIYLGTIEYTGDDYQTIWNLLLVTPGLELVCLGFEEGVELTDAQLNEETFPWNQWPLIIGALRDRSGSGLWTIHEGPEMKWFANRTATSTNANPPSAKS
jgi:hypothetical protein